MRPVPVFFDFVCPWSYSALHRERRLRREEGFRFTHVPWELEPERPATGSPFPEPEVSDELREFANASGVRDLRLPERASNTRRALRGLFLVRALAKEDAYLDACFAAVFERHEDLNQDATLRRAARESGIDEEDLLRACGDDAWDAVLAAGDAWAESLGVGSTVTYVLGRGKDAKTYQGLGAPAELREKLKASAEEG